MIFDTHAHYDDDQFDEDRDELLSHFKEKGVELVVNVCSSLESLQGTKELMETYDFIYGAVGIHPNEVGTLNEEQFKVLKEMAMHEKAAAIGETGLDYYWNEPDSSIQKKWFERQVELAKEMKKPVIVHSRDAAADTLDMIKALKAADAGGVVHCFSYGKEMAREYLDMGFYLGVGGVITFKNAKKLKEVVAYAPLEFLVLETDCPYLAPEPNRGKRNTSLNLEYVAEQIAMIKQITKEEVIEKTFANGTKLYGIG